MAAKFGHREVVDDADVTRNAHLVQIETFGFDAWFNAKSDGDIDQLEDDEPDDSDRNKVRYNADDFGQELRGIAIEKTCNGTRDAIPPVTITSVRKQSKRQASPSSVHSMNRDGADRIVDFHLAFDEQRRFDDENPGDETDQTRGRCIDECARSGDGD